MGKGDKKTKRGKIIMGSSGKTRMKKNNSFKPASEKVKPEIKEEKEIQKEEKKVAAKKKSTKKKEE